MKLLNSNHLSALLNITKDAALQKIAKIKGLKLQPESDFGYTEHGEKMYKKYKKELYDNQYITQDELKSIGFDFDVILADIHANYHKTPSCVSYCMEYVAKQLTPNKDGMIKRSINLPKDVLYFISMEQREFFRDLINKRHGDVINKLNVNVLV